MSAFAATMRIARRDALRHKARSALIVAMVAVPVLGLTAADVLARTMQLSAGERVTRTIGQADVGIQPSGGGRVQQGSDPTKQGFEAPGKPLAPPGSARAAALERRALAIVAAQPGALTTVARSSQRISANGLEYDVVSTMLDLRNPLTRGLATVLTGRGPATSHEVAVSPHLARRLGVTIGDVLTLRNGHRTITGTVQNPNDLRVDEVYQPAVSAGSTLEPLLLASTARPVSWAQVKALNALGFAVTSREVVEHPPADAMTFGSGAPVVTNDRIGVATVAIGLAVLEVVLLAGAAFAVGARRQRRDLAVVGAAGGDAGHAARIVLAGGLVLGGAGAVLGVGLGVLVARVALSSVTRLADRLPGHFDVRPMELVGLLALGVFTGVIAAILPARTAARDDVVAALTGRRGTVRTVRKVPAVGLVMIVIGTFIAVSAGQRSNFNQILLGAVVTELGFVLCAPTVVVLAARGARFFPLAPRLALRDAARHRGRSGPAVAAIMAAIAGTIAVSTYFASSVQQDRQAYVPAVRIGQVVLQVDNSANGAAVTAALARDLSAPVTRVPLLSCVVVKHHCRYLIVPSDPRTGSTLAVGGPRLLRLLSGTTDPGAESALQAGRLVLFSGERHGVSVTYESNSRGGVLPLPRTKAYFDDPGSKGTSFGGIVSPATAVRLGLRTGPGAQAVYVAATPTVLSHREEARLDDELGSSAELTVGRPYSPGAYSAGLVILAIAAAIVTLGATAISVGLSMAESKPDLVTLSAVGARPRTRRSLVAAQAGTVAVLGALLGTAAGLLPAWAVLRAHRQLYPFVVPWPTILVVVVIIPLLAMAGSAAFAGTRLTLDRRLA